jgi:hypothetical protein
MEYKQLTKGKTYTVKHGRSVKRYVYKGRYRDGYKNWRYHFVSLDGFATFTPTTKHVEVFAV